MVYKMKNTLWCLALLIAGVFGVGQMVFYFYNGQVVMATVVGFLGILGITMAVFGLLSAKR